MVQLNGRTPFSHNFKSTKMKSKKPKIKSEVGEPTIAYNRTIKVFNSFEEQAEYELNEMAKLSSEEILQQMRVFINKAYGMKGFNPSNLPKTHQIKITKSE